MRPFAISILVAATLVQSAVIAGDSEGAKKKEAEAGKAAEGPKGESKTANTVPKDPNNVKGISPYEELIGRGKTRAAAKDWSAAAAAFQEAIDLNPDEARGYLLLAQARRDSDVMDVVEKGRSKRGSEATEAQLLLVRAELLERKASATPTTKSGSELAAMLKSVWEQSREAWGFYATYLASHPRVPDNKATAEARRKAIEEREEREKRFAEVRAKRDNK